MNMIEMKELLGKYKFEDLDKKSQTNLLILLDKMNIIRKLYNSIMVVTSGVRTKEDQVRIYKEIAKKAKKPFDINKVPMKSKHLIGSAVDIFDSDKKLQKWCLDNQDKLKEIGVWIEDFKYTKNWVHFQIQPYGSYKEGKSIFFIP